MPVLRKREEVRLTGNYSPVAPRSNPMLEVNAQSAGNLARMAADYARGMVVEAEETAKALAKAAVFSTGPNGLPDLPDNLAARMGRAARRTYDAAMESRYIHQMTTSVRMRLSEIANANLSDPEAFIAESEAALAEMSADVPEAYAGAFQEAGTGLLVDHAASIGYQQATQLREEARGGVSTLIENGKATIIEQIRMEDYEGADASIQGLLAEIEAQPMDIMTREQKDAARDTIYYETGLARLIVENDLDYASPEQLQDLYTRLVAGSDPELGAYFTRAGMTSPDPQWMVRAGQHIMQLMGQANMRATAARDEVRTEVRMGEVMNGYAAGSKEDKDVLDLALSQGAKFRDQNGNQRALRPEDWLYADGQIRADMLQAVKGAGFASTSLEQVFRRLAVTSDRDELVAGALLYRDLREQPTADGTNVDLTGIAGPRMTAIFGYAEALHGSGDPGQDDLARAVEKVLLIEDDRWTEQDFANSLQSQRGMLGSIFREPITAENVDQAITRVVTDGVFDSMGVDSVPPKFLDDAKTVYRLNLETGMDPAAALESTRQGFLNRFSTSVAMPGVLTADAPERLYPAPSARTLGESLGNIASALEAEGVAFDEWVMELPNALIPNAIFSFESNQGADFMRAQPWELIAHDQITKAMAAEGITVEQLRGNERQTGHVERFMKPGRDYILKFSHRGPGGKPIYRASLKGRNGETIPLPGYIDIATDYEKFIKLSEATRAAELDFARKQRATGAEMEGVVSGQIPIGPDDYLQYLKDGGAK